MTDQKHKIKCIKPDCKGNGEYQYLGEEKSITLVDEEGNVTFRAGKYLYKCLFCHSTFSSEIAPISKKLILG
jgi:hypothetical protein